MSQQDFCFAVPQSLFIIIQRLQRAGHRVVIVGGALRDFLSGKSVCDYDLASDALPQQVQKLFHRCLPTGLQHGTLTILQDDDSYEITTFRSDGIYKDGRHPENVRFTGNLLNDLARRDFSINALAFEPHDTSGLKPREEWNPLRGWLHDPHGGRAHLEQKQICAIGIAAQRFEEDALRMLRACRFGATLDFKIEVKTLEAIRQMQQNLFRVSRPRIQAELRKLLCAPFALQGLRYLQQSQLWPHVFPSLPAESLHFFSRIWEHWHGSDSWLTLLLQMAEERGLTLYWNKEKVPILSLVWAMLHLALRTPISLPLRQVKQELEQWLQAFPQYLQNPVNESLYRRAERGLNELCFSNRERNGALDLLAHSQFLWGPEFLYLCQMGTQNDAGAYIRTFLAVLGQDLVLPALYLLGLSSQASGAPKELWLQFCTDLLDVLAQRPALSIKDLAIDGTMLVRNCGISPGPHMGKLLQKLLEHVLLQPQDNKSQVLQQLARQYDTQGYDLE